MTRPTCKVVRAGDAYVGQQGFTYLAGLTGATAGSRGICMTTVTLPDGSVIGEEADQSFSWPSSRGFLLAAH